MGGPPRNVGWLVHSTSLSTSEKQTLTLPYTISVSAADLLVWVVAVHCWSEHKKFLVKLNMDSMGIVWGVLVVDAVISAVRSAVKYQTAMRPHKLKLNCYFFLPKVHSFPCFIE